ncbi:hypothetical protein [Spiroplasma endosymbiont of Diplazon laetatorius]|uniref:hypothetical protein n=1 Tax=Spiroplasma endosymbiont of Diplazon laetatorius TaxID=3066322 RepID=UPI0030D39403
MKKILSFLGIVGFLATGLGSVMATSCKINNTQPDFIRDISKFVTNKDLGEIDGEEDLPTIKEIFSKIIEKNPECDFSMTILESILVDKNISTSTAEFVLSEFGLKSWYGELTLKYNYKKMKKIL